MEQNRTCAFYLPRKRRNCNMLVKLGQKYCGQHLVAEEIEGNSTRYKRIPCPLDSMHSCFEHRLEHHLAVCNARKKTNHPDHYRLDCNLGGTEDVAKVKIGSLSDADLLSFLTKVEAAHSEFVGPIGTSILHHELLSEGDNNIPGGPRHLAQNSSLLAHLRDAGLLHTTENTHTAYVEFGAGRGQLTHWLTRTVTDPAQATFILVDRGAHRYKCDAKMKYNDDLCVHRLRVDIKDLHLPALADLRGSQRLVAVGKHLCGAATDLAVQCVCRCKDGDEVVLSGLVLALCCHHRCSWTSYVAPHFFQEAGFSPSEFYTLTSLTSWGTCNPKNKKGEEGDKEKGKGNEKKSETELKTPQKNGEMLEREDDFSEEEGDINNSTLKTDNTLRKDQNLENRYARLGLSAGYREELGRLAKQILDEGRMRFLRGLGLQASLVQYVDIQTTPENIALIAWRET